MSLKGIISPIYSSIIAYRLCIVYINRNCPIFDRRYAKEGIDIVNEVTTEIFIESDMRDTVFRRPETLGSM